MIAPDGGFMVTGDAALIGQSVTEATAFAAVFDRHYPVIYRFLRGRVGADLAEDLASEVFSVAFQRRAAYDLSRPDSRPWLYGIAINLLRQHRRLEVRRLAALTRAGDPEGEAERRIGEGLDPVLAAALEGLSFEERSLILLLAWAELSYEQLAETLALPLGTVRSRLNRIRAKLRTSLSDVDGDTVELRGGDLL